MIERALDDGTIAEVITDDPEVANTAVQSYLRNVNGPIATEPAPRRPG